LSFFYSFILHIEIWTSLVIYDETLRILPSLYVGNPRIGGLKERRRVSHCVYPHISRGFSPIAGAKTRPSHVALRESRRTSLGIPDARYIGRIRGKFVGDVSSMFLDTSRQPGMPSLVIPREKRLSACTLRKWHLSLRFFLPRFCTKLHSQRVRNIKRQLALWYRSCNKFASERDQLHCMRNDSRTSHTATKFKNTYPFLKLILSRMLICIPLMPHPVLGLKRLKFNFSVRKYDSANISEYFLILSLFYFYSFNRRWFQRHTVVRSRAPRDKNIFWR